MVLQGVGQPKLGHESAVVADKWVVLVLTNTAETENWVCWGTHHQSIIETRTVSSCYVVQSVTLSMKARELTCPKGWQLHPLRMSDEHFSLGLLVTVCQVISLPSSNEEQKVPAIWEWVDDWEVWLQELTGWVREELEGGNGRPVRCGGWTVVVEERRISLRVRRGSPHSSCLFSITYNWHRSNAVNWRAWRVNPTEVVLTQHWYN